jgi:hypothetical protein
MTCEIQRFRWMWLLLPLLMLTTRGARAQVIPASDVYREVSELIQDLIRHEVGKSVANTVAKDRIKDRYFRETTARLESGFWGALDTTLEADLIELGVDFAYYVASHPEASKDAFWQCLKGDPDNLTDGCGFTGKQTLFEAHCKSTAVSIGCDVARTMKATLEQREEIARTEAVQLFADLVLSANIRATPTANELARFRERVRAWIAAPEGLRSQIAQIVADYDIPESDLQKREIDCSKPLTSKAVFDRATLVACFDDEKWKSRWDALNAVQVEIRATSPATQQWTVQLIRQHGVTTLESLVEAAATRACTAQEIGEANKALKARADDVANAKRALAEAQADRVKAQSSFDSARRKVGEKEEELKGLTDEGQIAAAKEEVKGHITRMNDAKKAADGAEKAVSEAKKRHDAAEKANTELQQTLKAYFDAHGVDCSGPKAKFLPTVALQLEVGGVPMSLSSPDAFSNLTQELTQLAARGLSAGSATDAYVKAFKERIAVVVCGGCALKDHVAAARRIIAAADFLFSMPLSSRERLLGDVSNAVELALVLGVDKKHERLLETLAQVLRASRRSDYRLLAATLLDALWPEPKTKTGSSDEMYRALFKSFAAFLMDARKGSATGEGTAVAFREAAKDVLVRLNKRGVPNVGDWTGYWVTPALRRSWNRTYPDGGRTLVSLDAFSLRWAASKYVGLGGSLFDLLAPFAELALRDQALTYKDKSEALLFLSPLQPRAFVWVAAPEFSRFLTVDAAVAYRPVTLSLVDDACESDCEYEYTLGHKKRDHLEMSVGVSVLF